VDCRPTKIRLKSPARPGATVRGRQSSAFSIKAATVNAAKLLDLSDEVGTIASGKSADVIAVDSSPLDDVSVLERVAFVMARGDVYLGVT
jgi:imidazolonepropionase-like amidohydrolase